MAANRRIGTLSVDAATILFLNIGFSQPELRARSSRRAVHIRHEILAQREGCPWP
jgi:hypothetical protein